MPAHSAGTAVAAVLQTAGFVSQADMLDQLEPLWTSVGVLLFTLSCISGIVMLVVFGSYRGAAYLILGPTIFNFLLFTRTEVSATVWKLGGMPERKIEDRFEFGPLKDYKPRATIKVAAFFEWYTRLIDQQMNEFTRVIRTFEKDEKLMRLPERQTLALMLKAYPEKPELNQMINYTLHGKCEEMIQAAIAMSSRKYTPSYINQLNAVVKSAQSPAAQTKAKEVAAFVQAQKLGLAGVFAAAKSQRISPDPAMKEFIKRKTELFAAKNAAGIDYPSRLADGKYAGNAQGFLAEAYPGLNITCGNAAEIVGEAAIEDGEWFMMLLYEGQASQLPETNPNDPRLSKRDKELRLCNAIASKLHPNYAEGTECDLASTVMVFMLRNTISQGSLSRIAQRTKNRSNLMLTDNAKVCANRMHLEGKEREFKIDPTKDVEYKYSDVGTQTGKQRVLEMRQQGVNNDEWCRVIDVNGEGTMETTFGPMQEFHSIGLAHTIFSYAINMPYYQGILLYYLAVGYPFICIVVIVPGRSVSFLKVPLFWLWVKSWDPGFALVNVFDKILWNVLPKTDLAYNQWDPKTGADGLPNVLQAALMVDPTYSLHIHFTLTALALLAVPAITASAILKGKSAIASTFSGAADTIARQANFLGSRAYGTGLQHNTLVDVAQRQGMALLSAGDIGDVPIIQNGKIDQAAAIGALGAMTTAIGRVANSGGNPLARVTTGILQGGSTGLEAAKIALSQISNIGEQRRWTDEDVGLFAKRNRMHKGRIAGLEGTPGFELHDGQNAGSSLAGAEIQLLMEQLQYGLKVSKGAASNITGGGIKVLGATSDGFKRLGGPIGKTSRAGVEILKKGAGTVGALEQWAIFDQNLQQSRARDPKVGSAAQGGGTPPASTDPLIDGIFQFGKSFSEYASELQNSFFRSIKGTFEPVKPTLPPPKKAPAKTPPAKQTGTAR